MSTSRVKTSLLWLTLFVMLAGFFFAGLAAIEPLFRNLAQKMPENYRYLVREYLNQRNYADAEKLIRRRLSQEFYDFEARFLLAEVQASSGHPAEAAATMVDTLQKRLAVRGRDVRAAGFDEPAMYELLGRYLWQAGNYRDAGEMLRAALDSGATRAAVTSVLATGSSSSIEAMESRALIALKIQDRAALQTELQRMTGPRAAATRTVLGAISSELTTKDAAATVRYLSSASEQLSGPPLVRAAIRNAALRAGTPELDTSVTASQSGGSSLDLDLFSLPNGARRTTESLELSRTSVTTARFDTGVFRTTSLLVRARGSEALGMSPILVIRSGDSELARLYLDGLQPREYDLVLWPDGAPKSLPLELAFENDASDLVTSDDRNVQILELQLH